MMNIQDFERDMSRESWTKIHRMMRKLGEMPRGTGWLEERAEIAATIAKYVNEDGMVGVVESGRDCDCVEYCHGDAQRVTVMSFERDRDQMYEWADGPCYMSICHVDDLPEPYSRDLVMEAYENGHPHFVTGATL